MIDMTEKRFKFRRFDVDVENINEIALYEIDNNPSDDLDESNLFYAYSTTHANIQDIVDKLNNQEERIKELEKENKQLKEKNATMKGRIINSIIESNKVECSCNPCVCEDYVKKELMRD